MPEYDYRGKFGIIYDSMAKNEAIGKNKTFQKLSSAYRRRLMIDFANKQHSRNINFGLQTRGSILDQSLLEIDSVGNVKAPHDNATAYLEASHYFQINDIRLSINPANIQISQDNFDTKDWVIRAAGKTKTKSGRGVIFFSLNIPFVGNIHVNTELRRLLAQVRTIPIMYIDNQLIRQHVYPNDNANSQRNMAAIVSQAVISTHPDSTNMLMLTLSMEAFNYSPYSDDLLYLLSSSVMTTEKPKVTLQTPSKAKPRTTSKAPSTEKTVLAVKTPAESPLFKAYYDFILGMNYEDLPTQSKDKQAAEAFKKMFTLATKGIKKHYTFRPISFPMQGDISFTYDVYFVLDQQTYSKLFKPKNGGKKGQPQPQFSMPGEEFLQGGVWTTPKSTIKKVNAVPAAIRLGNKNSGHVSGKMVNASDIVAKAKTYLGRPYSKQWPRTRMDTSDCSSFVFNVVRLAGVGNIGWWTRGQYAELERLNSQGFQAYIKVRVGKGTALIGVPIKIVGQEGNFLKVKGKGNETRDVSKIINNTKTIINSDIMGIPGVILHSWGWAKKNNQSVYVPQHAMMGYGMSGGKAQIIHQSDPVNIKTIKPVSDTYIETRSRAGGGSNRWWWHNTASSAFLLPNVIYDYESNKKAFDAILNLEGFQTARKQIDKILNFNSEASQKQREQQKQELKTKETQLVNLSRNVSQKAESIVARAIKSAKSGTPDLKEVEKALNDAAPKPFRINWATGAVGPQATEENNRKIRDIVAKLKEYVSQASSIRKASANLIAELQKQRGSNILTKTRSQGKEKHTAHWYDSDYFNTQVLMQFEQAKKKLEDWVSTIRVFLRQTAKNGWSPVWLKDGTMILRRPVTLKIKPGRKFVFNDGRTHSATISHLSVSLSNMFARIPIISQRFVTHQFLGSGDAEANLVFDFVGNGVLAQLQYMYHYTESAARILRRLPGAGVIHVENELINFAGCESFIVDNLSTQTMAQSPNMYKMTLKLTEWKRDQEVSQALTREYYTNTDRKSEVLKRLGELLSERHKVKVFIGNLYSTSIYDLLIETRFLFNGQHTLTFKKLSEHVNSSFRTKLRGTDGRIFQVSQVDGLLLSIVDQMRIYMDELLKGNALAFSGWTRESLLQAMKTPGHPFYVFGFADIFFKDMSKDAEKRIFKIERFINTFAYKTFEERLIKEIKSVTLDEGGGPKYEASMVINPYWQRTLPKEEMKKKQKAWKDFPLWKKLTSALEGVRARAKIASEYNAVKYSGVLDKFGSKKSYSASHIGNYDAMGWIAEISAGLANVGSNLTTNIMDFIEKMLTGSTPRARFAQKLLGPKAAEVRDRYVNIKVDIRKLKRGANYVPASQTSAKYSLVADVHLEQLKVAAAIANLFNQMSSRIVRFVNGSLRNISVSPELVDLFNKLDGDSIMPLKGAPAYTDIPTMTIPRTMLDSKKGLPAEYSHLNPDFYWFNADDYHYTSLERIARFGLQANEFAISSYEFAKQFGMVPFTNEHIKKVNAKTGKEGKRIVTEVVGSPGIYAMLGGGAPKHEGQIGPTSTLMLANRLPETLATSTVQKISHVIPAGKSANGTIAIGVGDSGVSQESLLHTWYADSTKKAGLDGHALYQEKHPMGLDRVVFGPAGLSEFRTPVMLDRRPENIFKQLQKSISSYKRNTHKMRRALPAFKMYFIEEDTSGMGGLDKSIMMHSYDDFFSYSAVKEIKMVRDRKNPADLLIVRVSNVLGYLDTVEFSNKSLSQQIVQSNKPMTSQSTRDSTSAFGQDTELENPFTRFILKQGVRVQFKLGYENDPDDLETVLNGQVVQINQVSANEIVIICQSFGTQLVSYKKGVGKKDIPKQWIDTFDLLSWAICQPELTHFGRWQLNSQASVLESRSKGGWEKVYSFLTDPRDDNIYVPTRAEMLKYQGDHSGGTTSYLLNKVSQFIENFTSSKMNLSVGVGKTKKTFSGEVKYIMSMGNRKVYSATFSGINVWDVTKKGYYRSSQGHAAISVKEKSTKTKKAHGVKGSKGKDVQLFFNTWARGDSKILDYHVYRTTVWDIFQEMELRHPGWIAAPVPYGSRMTMFFGLPTQLYWSRPRTASEKAAENATLQSIRAQKDADATYRAIKNEVYKHKHGWLARAERHPIVGSWVRNPIKSIGTAVLVTAATALAIKLALGATAAVGTATIGGTAGRVALWGRVTDVATKSWSFLRTMVLGRGAQLALPFQTGVIVGRRAAALALARSLGQSVAASGIAKFAARGLATAVVVGGALNTKRWWDKSFSNLLFYENLLSMAGAKYSSRLMEKALQGRYVPFRRYHLVTSDHHIVANNIKASVHGTYNAVSVEYLADSEDGVDASNKGNVATETKVLKASDRILDKNVRMGHFSFPNCRGRWMADRYMQGLLMRFMKDTYKGQLLILGNPSIKPHDRVLIMDSYTEMNGPIDVEKVIHTLSPQTGFLTEITPDLVVYGNNIVDMPYDDYLSVKLAWEEINYKQAIMSAVRYPGSPYQQILGKYSGMNPNGRSKMTAQGVKYLNNKGHGYASPGKQALAAAFGAVIGVAAGGGPIGGIAAGIAGLAGSRSFNPYYRNTMTNFIPFFGSTAIKFYEWSTQRQPLIIQPLFIAGRPFIAGFDIDKVNMVQHFQDRFIPVRKTLKRGFSVLANAGNAVLNANVSRVLDQLPLTTNYTPGGSN